MHANRSIVVDKMKMSKHYKIKHGRLMNIERHIMHQGYFLMKIWRLMCERHAYY